MSNEFGVSSAWLNENKIYLFRIYQGVTGQFSAAMIFWLLFDQAKSDKTKMVE